MGRDYLEKLLVRFGKILKGKDLPPIEAQLHKKDGSKIWVSLVSSIFKIRDNVYIQVIGNDISERKKAEQELKASEEKYRSILENIKEGYFEVDLEGNFTFMNDAFADAVGYKKDELIGINYNHLVDNENAKKVFHHYNEVYRSEVEQTHFEYAATKKNGEKIYVDTSAYLKYDAEGEIIGFAGLGRDITERKIAEKSLEESEKKFRTIFEAIPDLFFLVAKDTTIIDYRGEREDLYIPPEKFKGKRMMELLPEELGEITFRAVNKTLETKEPQIIEYELTVGERVRFFEARNLYFSEDEVAIFIREITERKEAEDLIREEVKKLKELDEMRKDLISRVSHELKTPLMSISGATELLLYVHKNILGEDSEPRELVNMIDKGCQRLTGLVSNLLDISRIDFKKLILDKEINDLSETVKECVDEMNILLKERNISIEVEIPDTIRFNFDRFRVSQVIMNLLSNAIKNTPPKGEIKIKLERYKNWAILSVSDTGVGFTPEEIKKLFTRFGKIERYGKGMEFIDIQGSGLGLYISKEIIDLHQGKIWVQSDGRNKGSTFTFRLPITED
mgnify:CR=1 FL=1